MCAVTQKLLMTVKLKTIKDKGLVNKYQLQNTKLVWGAGAVHTRFWWQDLKEKDHLEDLGVDGMII
jgi:hypothetical protein